MNEKKNIKILYSKTVRIRNDLKQTTQIRAQLTDKMEPKVQKLKP